MKAALIVGVLGFMAEQLAFSFDKLYLKFCSDFVLMPFVPKSASFRLITFSFDDCSQSTLPLPVIYTDVFPLKNDISH